MKRAALLALLLCSCGGDAFTTGDTAEESLGGAPGATGGAEEPGTGGSIEEPTGGATGATGGASGPTPPTEPTSCPAFTCGTITHEGEAGTVYCYQVTPNQSTAGNLTDTSTGDKPGSCVATLDGSPEDFSDGVKAGRLLVWGCSFWFNCY